MVGVVYKYELNLAGVTSVQLPTDAKILCVKEQRGRPVLYVLTEQGNNERKTKYFYSAMTGQPVNDIDADSYVGTVMLANGDFVVHVFEG